ncbi:hypothetical protein EIN_229430, partial [Entamoeba invadens IP1]
MQNVFHTSTFTPLLSSSSRGNLGVGGSNICYISDPDTNYLINLEMPLHENVDIGMPTRSNATFVIPGNDYKTVTNNVTSMNWSKNDYRPNKESLLVCWNCQTLVMYTEQKNMTTPTELWKIEKNVSELLHDKLENIWSDEDKNNETNHEEDSDTLIKRGYELFIINAVFTENNNAIVLTPNSLFHINLFSDEVTLVELENDSKNVVTYPQDGKLFCIVGNIFGQLDVYCFQDGNFTTKRTKILDKDFCLPNSLVIIQNKLFVLKSTFMYIVDLTNYDVVERLCVGLVSSLLKSSDGNILLHDYNNTVRVFDVGKHTIDFVCENAVAVTESCGCVSVLIPQQNVLNHSIYPNHLLMRFKNIQHQQSGVFERHCINEMEVMWDKMKTLTTQFRSNGTLLERDDTQKKIIELRREISFFILMKLFAILFEEKIEFQNIPKELQEMVLNYESYIGHFECPVYYQQYLVESKGICPLCKKPSELHSGISVCELNHQFDICSNTKQTVLYPY